MKNERGLVSLISTSIIAVLLVIITVAMVYTSTSLSRQASDSDLSARAYYAAESGVEDSIYNLTNSLVSSPDLATLVAAVNSPTCTHAPQTITGASNSGESYVCRTVSVTTDTVTDKSAADETTEYRVSTTGLDHIVINWNLKDQDSPAPTAFSGSFDPSTWTAPAAIELTTIDYPANGGTVAFASTSTHLNNYIVQPGNSGAGGTSNNTKIIKGNFCTTTGSPYSCSATIGSLGVSSAAFVVRLRPRYTGTHFQIQFYNSSNTLISVTDSKATIDVTAQAGDVLRRVATKVKVRAGVLSGLDYGLYSDTVLCKSFKVDASAGTALPNAYGAGSCPP